MKVRLEVLNRRLASVQKMILKDFSQLAAELGMRIYLVGGPVRDLILKRELVDLDLLLDSDLETFLKYLERRPGVRIERSSFLTAKIFGQNFSIDLAQARQEFYPHPGALPRVEPGTLEEDAKRRDFTVNALMLEVKREKFISILDYVNGLRDLEEGLIRVIHRESFWDDATRIIRAVRYQKRFGFKIERKTLSLLKEALRKDVFATLTPQRLGAEFLRTLKEKKVADVIEALFKLNAIYFLSERVSISSQKLKLLREWDEYRQKERLQYYWLIPLYLIVGDLKEEEVKYVFSVLELTRPERKIVLSLFELKAFQLLDAISRNPAIGALYEKLNSFNQHQICYLYLLASGTLKKMLKNYLEKYLNLKLEITGEDVKKLGIPEGPLVGKILEQVKRAKVRGEVKDRRAEIGYLKKLIQQGNVDRLS